MYFACLGIYGDLSWSQRVVGVVVLQKNRKYPFLVWKCLTWNNKMNSLRCLENQKFPALKPHVRYKSLFMDPKEWPRFFIEKVSDKNHWHRLLTKEIPHIVCLISCNSNQFVRISMTRSMTCKDRQPLKTYRIQTYRLRINPHRSCTPEEDGGRTLEQESWVQEDGEKLS